MQHIHGSERYHYSCHVMMPLCCVINVLHSEAVSVSFIMNFPSNTALLHQEKKKRQNLPCHIFVVFEGLIRRLQCLTVNDFHKCLHMHHAGQTVALEVILGDSDG